MSSFGSDPGGTEESRVRLEWPGVPARTTPRPSPGDAEATPAAPIPDPESSQGSTPRRELVDADDRLADRLLQRLLTIHEDMGSDFAALRLEVAALRLSIDELSEHPPTGHLGSVLDELAQLRAEVTQQSVVAPAAPKLGSLAPLVAEIAALREEVSLDPVVAQLVELRTELTQLRRRMRLRADRTDTQGF